MIAALALSWMLQAPAARAATTDDDLGGFTIGGAAGWFWSDPYEHIGSTWTAVLRPGYRINDRVYLEADVSYMQGRTREGTFERVYSSFVPRLNLLVVFTPNFVLQPFVAAGGGFIYKDVWRPEKTWEPQCNDLGWGNYQDPDTDAVVNMGPGLMIEVNRVLAFRADFRYVLTLDGDPCNADIGHFNNWEATGGLMFRFGWGMRDRDRDTIPDRDDLCREDPEDFDGFQDADGCPDPDNDDDGIVDAQDQCRDRAEDFDGFKDADGCPDEDNDFDGLADRDDKCPTEAEDKDGFEDEDGCPEADNDKDGLVDLQDRCPNDYEDPSEWQGRPELRDGCPDWDRDRDGIRDDQDACPDQAEDRDLFEDEDGCPDLDNDQDGVVDLQDDCPFRAEDIDDFQDADGCPDRDNDGDGVEDGTDKCPLRAEIYNGFEDEDGCPDELPKEVKRFSGVIRGINFEVDSDRITVDSYPVLDEAVDVLQRYPSIRIEVQGHTDSDGSEEYNLDLSERRARAVVEYLIRRGVDPDRLTWIGYGESRPLVPNDTPEGKAVNRRVEFRILYDEPAPAGDSDASGGQGGEGGGDGG